MRKYPQLGNVQYLTEQLSKKSLHAVAEEIGCSYSALVFAKNKHGIKIGDGPKIRRLSETRSESVRIAIKKKFPDGRRGVLAANWRGGRRVANRAGYIYIHQPDHPHATKEGYVMEHRLVLEKKLGRYLESHEIAHHINGNKKDNRPENIELTVRGQHTQEHFRDSFLTKRLIEIISACPKCFAEYKKLI